MVIKAINLVDCVNALKMIMILDKFTIGLVWTQRWRRRWWWWPEEVSIQQLCDTTLINLINILWLWQSRNVYLQLNNALRIRRTVHLIVLLAFKVNKFLLFHCLLQPQQQQQKVFIRLASIQRHAVSSLVEQHHNSINSINRIHNFTVCS